MHFWLDENGSFSEAQSLKGVVHYYEFPAGVSEVCELMSEDKQPIYVNASIVAKGFSVGKELSKEYGSSPVAKPVEFVQIPEELDASQGTASVDLGHVLNEALIAKAEEIVSSRKTKPRNGPVFVELSALGAQDKRNLGISSVEAELNKQDRAYEGSASAGEIEAVQARVEGTPYLPNIRKSGK